MDLLRSPWGHEFERLLDSVENSLVLCAPYVGAGPCQLVMNRIERRSASVDLDIVTDLCRDNLLSGVTDVASLLRLAKAIPHTRIRFLPSLHAKVYLADQKRAIITSSNLTNNGMLLNFEYGVSIGDPLTVANVRADILRYSQLGSPVDQVQLLTLVHITEDLRDLSQTALRSVNRRLRREFDRRLAAADLEILRVRTAGRTAHAIFADAVLHLLRSGPMRTVELNRSIQRIHPDLCDDSVDRVIDGQHFGKKWKHGVRTAQAFLRRAGRIERVGDRWSLVTV
jgi:phosphatidylserine/phosphatidylglycerophosphate/cardiolipin synthase-like enzyme